jgi:hypothetical protein
MPVWALAVSWPHGGIELALATAFERADDLMFDDFSLGARDIGTEDC